MQPQIVKVNPCQVYLWDGSKFCFNPEQIKAIHEVPASDKDPANKGIGCYLYISGFDQPFGLACPYDLFLERCGVTPQKIEETRE